MGRAVAYSIAVALVMIAIAGIIALFTMVALNGFGEHKAARIMMVIAAGYFISMFLIVSKVARSLLPEGDQPKARLIGGVLTALPALPTFGLLLLF